MALGIYMYDIHGEVIQLSIVSYWQVSKPWVVAQLEEERWCATVLVARLLRGCGGGKLDERRLSLRTAQFSARSRLRGKYDKATAARLQ